MLEVEPMGQCGRMASRSGQKILEAENLKSTISQKASQRESWLLLNVNRKIIDCPSLAVVAGIA